MPIINTGQTYFKTDLTGRTRHRRQWWTGALVLQVEVADKTRHGLYVDGQPPAANATGQEWRAYARRCKAEEAQSWAETGRRWRDATPQDMALITQTPPTTPTEPTMNKLPEKEMSDQDRDTLAFALLRHMHGLPLCEVNNALQRAQQIAQATMTLDTTAPEFERAQEAATAAKGWSGVMPPKGWACAS